MHTSDKALVETLTRSKIFRDYVEAFRTAVGLPLALTPAETWGLPLHDDPNESPFCRTLASCSKSCASCLQTQATIARQAGDSTANVTCPFGLRDSAVPVRLGSRLVGFLRTGQVFTHQPDEADFQKVTATLSQLGVSLRPDDLRDAYFATKVVTSREYEAVLRLLEVFARHLVSLSNQILVSEETAENPQIERTREFIAQNLSEEITLADCARTARMSTFYFCKMFKRATGLSLTEYLARLRVERSKARLLDSRLRISEVAFEVGFQSLSQFNRVFKKVAGQSPTEYRRSLFTSRPLAESDGRRRVVGLGEHRPSSPSFIGGGDRSVGSVRLVGLVGSHAAARNALRGHGTAAAALAAAV